MLKNDFKIYDRRSNSSILIIMVPHSGRDYEKYFMSQTSLKLNELRKSEDCFIDLLFNNEGLNYNYIKANFPRIFIDVNRSPLEIDKNMWSIFTQNCKSYYFNSSKVKAGIGVIPKYSFSGFKIYGKILPFSEARRRLLSYYFPYHKRLRMLINEIKSKYKKVIALDCHSMSSSIVSNDIDIILSNNYGNTSSINLLKDIEKIFMQDGYKVKKNYLFKGGFITRHYGNPMQDNHFIQIEINKKLYVNELNLKIKEKEFYILKNCFSRIINYINSKKYLL